MISKPSPSGCGIAKRYSGNATMLRQHGKLDAPGNRKDRLDCESRGYPQEPDATAGLPGRPSETAIVGVASDPQRPIQGNVDEFSRCRHGRYLATCSLCK
jgi:hypothetical protein